MLMRQYLANQNIKMHIGWVIKIFLVIANFKLFTYICNMYPLKHKPHTPMPQLATSLLFPSQNQK
jgi:hypothetical protein